MKVFLNFFWLCLMLSSYPLLSEELAESNSQMATLRLNNSTKPVLVGYEKPYKPNQSLKNFIKSLKKAAKQKNQNFILSKISEKFTYTRDFGGMITANMNHLERFEQAYTLDNSKLSEEYQNHGWESLLSDLSANKHQLIDGHICAPAEVKLPDNVNDYYYFRGGYIDGYNVYIRSKPSAEGALITKMDYQALLVVDAFIEDEKGRLWVKVLLPDNRMAYVAAKYFSYFLQPKLCFQKIKGNWAISMYVGGGD
ncbi:MAG: SH3 domain-containing protein [Methylococcaceae bacterium]|nr:SH3 domain-containing protein [Methylococcaceae bacterium]